MHETLLYFPGYSQRATPSFSNETKQCVEALPWSRLSKNAIEDFCHINETANLTLSFSNSVKMSQGLLDQIHHL